MAEAWTGVVLDRFTGSDVEQPVPLRMGRYTLPQTAQGRFTPGNWHFNIPLLTSANYREQQEWIAGVRDLDTLVWNNTHSVAVPNAESRV